MTTKIYAMLLNLIIVFTIQAQVSHPITCAKIMYERKVSLKKKILSNREEDDVWMDAIIKNTPNTVSDIFSLIYSPDQSLYQFEKSVGETKTNFWSGNDLGSKNTVYKNFTTRHLISKKQVFENDIIVKDSIPKMQWKLTNEFREILGHECRKATTIIGDSLFVIAFYTDDLQTPTGPESFSDLPGVILGIVMPRLFTTWFATEIITVCDFDDQLKPPSKGKSMDRQEIDKILFERFGKYKKWYHNMRWSLII